MDILKTATTYHDATKHHYGRYARALGYLDWATQPDPFRRYRGAPLYLLPLGEDRTAAYEALYVPGSIPPAPLTVATISTFFEGSMAVSAWKQYQEARWELRCDPSSGNLHPTEGYAILPALDDGALDRPGIYHYAPREHGLERRGTFAPEVWKALAAGFPPGTFFAGLASIHWREAWKYGERAYRYCQHDVGHALGALAFAAAALGRRVAYLEGLGDADVARLLGLDRDADFAEAEREHPDLLAAVVPAGPGETVAVPRTLAPEAIEAVGRGEWTGRANGLSKDHVDWEIIDAVSDACRKPRTVTIPGAASLATPARGAETTNAPGPSALAIFKQRRSAVAMDARTALSRAAFFRMMERAMPRSGRAPFAALGAPAAIHLGLFVHRVVDLVPGLYVLVRREEALLPLWATMRERFAWERAEGAPADLPLYLLEPKDARMIAASTSCQQSIAADGVFAAAMLGEFDARLARHGPWFYRRLHWEAGLIGQVLYLEAEALGVRATGIGCFFDEPSAEVFGLQGDPYRTIYHFTVGGAVDDPRLMTLAPYDEARRARWGWERDPGDAR